MANRTVTAELEMKGRDATGPMWKSVAARMGQMEKQFGRFNRTAEQFNSKIRNIERTTSAMAKVRAGVDATSASAFAAISRFVGPAAVAYGAKKAIDLAGDFEESLSKIQKKSGATAEQMAVLKDQIFELGRQIPVSHSEIAAGFERGAAAGIPVDKLKDFATLSVKVADAWDTSAENVANTFAGFNVGLGIPIDKLEAYASLINDLADAGIADETGIADFIDRVGASLKNFGLTPEQIAAYGATLLDLKMPADVAARAMDTFTGKLFAPENLSKKSYSALSSVVGDMKSFQKMTGDQKVKFFFQQLSKLSNQQRASKLGALLGEGFDDEITRLVAGLDHLNERLKMAEDRASNPSNSVATGFQKKLQLWNSQTELLLNKWKEIAEKIGEIGIEGGNIVLPGVNGATDVVLSQISKTDALHKQLRSEGMSYAEILAWEAKNSPFPWSDGYELNKKIFQGGYRDPQFVAHYMEQFADTPEIQKMRGRGQGNFVELPPIDHGYTPTNLPKIGPYPFPGSAPRDQHLREIYSGNRGRYVIPSSSNSASTTLPGDMQTRDFTTTIGEPGHGIDWKRLFWGDLADGGGLIDHMKVDLSGAGEEAGQKLGQAASDKISSDAGNAGQSFGQSAGAAFLSILNSWKPNINISGYSGNQGVNANVGKSTGAATPPTPPAGGGW